MLEQSYSAYKAACSVIHGSYADSVLNLHGEMFGICKCLSDSDFDGFTGQQKCSQAQVLCSGACSEFVGVPALRLASGQCLCSQKSLFAKACIAYLVFKVGLLVQ